VLFYASIKRRNAIRFNSFFTATELAGVSLYAAGDETTWGAEVGVNSDEAVDPPNRHERLTEVAGALRTSSRRHTRMEGPPFGHGERRQWRRGKPPMEGLPSSQKIRRQ
jgi:hypothetical protein